MAKGACTVFNILASLTNPAALSRQLLGVYAGYLVEPLANVLISLGVKHGMVVYGQDKMDEISVSAPITICKIKARWFKSAVIAPEDFGLKRCQEADLVGGTPEENAQITCAILQEKKGPKRDVILMNASAAWYIGCQVDNLSDGIAYAAQIIDLGKALATPEQFITVSNRLEEDA